MLITTIPEHTSRCTTSCTEAGILCSALELSSSNAMSTSSAARYSFISSSDRYLQQERDTVQNLRLRSITHDLVGGKMAKLSALAPSMAEISAAGAGQEQRL